MEYLKIFGDPKNDFINHLIYKLSYEINYCINKIYNNCKLELKDNKNNILFIFQKLLEEIPKWDKNILKNETIRIKNRIPIIKDLITCILISNTRLLCSFKNNEKIKIKVPKLSLFIHKCYILIAKELWQYTYLFSEDIDKLSIQKNKKIINDIIKNNIENVIMIFLPIKSILKCYINNNLNNNNELEISETLNNILSKNKEQKNIYSDIISNNNRNSDVENKNTIENYLSKEIKESSEKTNISKEKSVSMGCIKEDVINLEDNIKNTSIENIKNKNIEDTIETEFSKNIEIPFLSNKIEINNSKNTSEVDTQMILSKENNNKELKNNFINEDFEFNENYIIDKPIKLYNDN